jgi:hypothetical protein
LYTVFALLFLSAVGISEAQNASGAEALAKLRNLAGEWTGSVEWSGARSDRGIMNATYYTTGHGSAMVENLSTGGEPDMTSVYHLDGADLRMTHFCGTGNQPRLKASKIDNAQGILDFSFVDATNLASAEAPHVYGVEMRFISADHFTLTFLFEGAGKRSRERIDLKRMGEKPASNSR